MDDYVKKEISKMKKEITDEKKIIDDFTSYATDSTIYVYDLIFDDILKSYKIRKTYSTEDSYKRTIEHGDTVGGYATLSLNEINNMYNIDLDKPFYLQETTLGKFLKYSYSIQKRYAVFHDSVHHNPFLVDIYYLKDLFREDGFDIKESNDDKFVQLAFTMKFDDFEDFMEKNQEEKNSQKK